MSYLFTAIASFVGSLAAFVTASWIVYMKVRGFLPPTPPALADPFPGIPMKDMTCASCGKSFPVPETMTPPADGLCLWCASERYAKENPQ